MQREGTSSGSKHHNLFLPRIPIALFSEPAKEATTLAKQPPLGDCHICGTNGKLTFEHVPPRAAFNKWRVRRIPGSDLIGADLDSPSGGEICQRGAGGYTLCGQCNNETGGWYGDAFVDWTYQAMRILSFSFIISLVLNPKPNDRKCYACRRHRKIRTTNPQLLTTAARAPRAPVLRLAVSSLRASGSAGLASSARAVGASPCAVLPSAVAAP